MSSDNAAPILSRESFIAKLTAAIGDARLNFSGMDIAAHDAAQREEIQRLTEELSERSSYIANYEHATKIERAERDAELSALRAELETVKVDHAGDLTALCFVRSRLIGLRHEACNDELHELSEELTSILSFIDAAAAISQTAQPPAEPSGNTGELPCQRCQGRGWTWTVAAGEYFRVVCDACCPDCSAAQPANDSVIKKSTTPGKPELCPNCFCSQTLPESLQSCACECHRMDRLIAELRAQPATEQPRIWRVAWKDGHREGQSPFNTYKQAQSRARKAIRHDYNYARVQFSTDNGETWIDEQAEREGK